MNLPIIGKKVLLRQFERTDFNSIRLWVNNKAVTKGLMDSDVFEHYHTEEETLGFLESSLEIDLDRIRLVVASNEDNKYLGQIELFAFEDNRTVCELDIVIAEPNKWNSGIGSESICMLCNYMVEYFGVQRFKARIKHSNKRAQKIAEKNGFKVKEIFANYSVYLKSEEE